ncbi:SseB family protein [Priestia megaterium]|uniref:SseB family protein n=1 Tax=Priestia megaterium TaxID=1404 RepID=UPI002E1C33CD|nr:SseB family protein [Priestia megaterium]MED3979542.1 SseB family protein [Priestia megaterium]
MKYTFNLLEKSLIEAMKDNKKIAQFYKTLMNSNVWLVASSESVASDILIAKHYVQTMKSAGYRYLPVFSSKYPIEQMLKDEKTVCVAFKDMLPVLNEGIAILLNPDTPLSKLFIPEEIRMLKEEQNYFKQ